MRTNIRRKLSDGTVVHVSTAHAFPPIPTRAFDWSAITADYEPGQPLGWGHTEEEAVCDLLDQLEQFVP